MGEEGAERGQEEEKVDTEGEVNKYGGLLLVLH
jgi:hypothetical protein